MSAATLKTLARHLAVVKSGRIEKTNVIGIRKAINAIERERDVPADVIDAVFLIEQAIAEHHPTVTGELHETGLKVLRNPRYKSRWTDAQRAVIDARDVRFDLIRFDRIGGERGGRWQAVPVYRVIGFAGSFAFRNIPWQTAYFGGHEDGPRVVPEREYVG